jgi:cytochrome c oxidase cbb3-type subunit 3
MLGVGRRDIAALSAWIGKLSLRTRVAAGGGLALGLILMVWAVLNAQEEARLLRAEPDLIPADSAMMRFATSRGYGLYQAHCASCHGADGQGHYAVGVPNLTDKDWLYGDGEVSDIETVVQYGIRASNGRTWRLADMPAFAHARPYAREPTIKSLSPGDIGDVMQFLRLLEDLPADPAASQRGVAIFAGRGGCFDCHSRDGHGDPAIGAPNLTDSIWLYGDGSPKWIYDTIANGRAGVCPAWSGRLGPAQIREVSLYVYSLSHGSSQPKPSLQ